jgi:hypothetical protein
MVSTSQQRSVEAALAAALDAYGGIERARELHRLRVTEFMSEARSAGWTWQRIGEALNVTDTGARRFFFRNRKRLAGV